MKDAPLSDLLGKASIKTENQLMVFSDYIWKDYTDTVIITGSYIIFFQVGPIYHCTHVPGPFAHSIA